MRVLDIGWGLGGGDDDDSPIVRSDEFERAGSFYDFDAVFVDPEGISSLWTEHLRPDGDGFFRSHSGEDGGLSRGLLNLMEARRKEARSLLEEGNGLLVCKLRKPGRPLKVVNREGETEVDVYSWLPREGRDSLIERGDLRKAQGERLVPSRSSLPLAGFLRSHAEEVSYEAALSGLDQSDEGSGEVLASTPGGEVAALGLEFGGGNLCFLPAGTDFDPEARKELLEAAGEQLGGGFASEPAWLEGYRLADEEKVRTELEEIDEEVKALERARAEKEKELDSLSSVGKLLSAGYDHALKRALRKTLSRYGFEPEEGRSGIDLRLESPRGSFAIKVGTENGGPVGLAPYHELVQGINELEIHENDDPQGVLVINGYADLDPEERPEQAKEELQDGCNLYGFTLVEATELYEALSGREDRARKADNLVELFRQD